MNTNPPLPKELEILAQRIEGEPAQSRELLHYALTMLMVEDGRAEIIDRPVIDSHEHLTIKTLAGDVFTIARPAVSDELLNRMREMARRVLQEGNEPLSKQSD